MSNIFVVPKKTELFVEVEDKRYDLKVPDVGMMEEYINKQQDDKQNGITAGKDMSVNLGLPVEVINDMEVGVFNGLLDWLRKKFEETIEKK